jgi:hypothetical protein
MIAASGLLALILFLCFVPVPLSRIRGLALVQGDPDHSAKVALKRSSILHQLKVQPGEEVHQGQVLAVFRDPDLEDKLFSNLADLDKCEQQLQQLEQQKKETADPVEKGKIDGQIAEYTGKYGTALATVTSLRRIQEEELYLTAPCDGVIGKGPKIDDVGKKFEGSHDQAQTPELFTIYEPGKVQLWMPLTTIDYNQLRENLAAVKKKKVKKDEEPTLPVSARIHGMGSSRWDGKIVRLEESEMKTVIPMLSSKGGGPVPVKPTNGRALVPQEQYYLVHIDLIDAEPTIIVGEMAQVKISCENITCREWLWRRFFDLYHKA